MTSASWYTSFDELRQHEREGVDFTRKATKRGSRIAVIAPHGGGIEPGTSELATAIAGWNYSSYTFEGLKSEGNELLHVTSTLFDEPKGLDIVEHADIVVAIHGCGGDGAK